MDREHEPLDDDRRRFLRRVGRTVAAGLGLAAFGADAAAAGRPGRRPRSCVHYCRHIECWSASCGGPTPHLTQCSDECELGTYYYCSDRPCPSGWCRNTLCA